jgi:Tubulin binding cofactor C
MHLAVTSIMRAYACMYVYVCTYSILLVYSEVDVSDVLSVLVILHDDRRCLLGSVRIEESTNCTLLLSPCCTSAYMELCSDCTIFVACHQLRIHTSHRCNLYVQVNSHPIIEDCTALGFAPYSLTHDQISDDFKVSASILWTCLDRSTSRGHPHETPDRFNDHI